MLTLQESFNNVRLVCDGVTMPGLDNTQRQAVNESLSNIVGALQAYELMLKEAEIKGKDKESEPEDEIDADKD